MEREEAIQLTREFGGKYPSTYLGKDLKEILNYINISEEEFKLICERFTNKKITTYLLILKQNKFEIFDWKIDFNLTHFKNTITKQLRKERRLLWFKSSG